MQVAVKDLCSQVNVGDEIVCRNPSRHGDAEKVVRRGPGKRWYPSFIEGLHIPRHMWPGIVLLKYGMWRDEKVVRHTAIALASYQGEPGLIPGGTAPGFSYVGIVADDAVISKFSPGSPVPGALALRRCSITHLTSPSSALKASMLRAAHISFHSTFEYNPLETAACLEAERRMGDIAAVTPPPLKGSALRL
ncbi:hypothetical protein PR048_017818 [Dryococelus australis]|uniref:Uncharacterized protein n=1 Tax=Dryococelus australis TaxID=614101 RepID=A0ABQ9HAI7_9NEOP|nr:hypothetical protein PR048_017818 [Dryococelus australis]